MRTQSLLASLFALLSTATAYTALGWHDATASSGLFHCGMTGAIVAVVAFAALVLTMLSWPSQSKDLPLAWCRSLMLLIAIGFVWAGGCLFALWYADGKRDHGYLAMSVMCFCLGILACIPIYQDLTEKSQRIT